MRRRHALGMVFRGTLGLLLASRLTPGPKPLRTQANLRPRPASDAHPRLFFGPGDLENLRAKCRGAARSQFDVIAAYANTHLSDAPPTSLGNGYERKGDLVQEAFLPRILIYSFLYALEGDATHLEAGKRWSLSLAQMPAWAGEINAEGRCANCGYPEGWVLTALAVAYDWLYPGLGDSDRDTLVRSITRLCKILNHATYEGEWWTGAYLHHDTWVPIGGFGVGALSIAGEVAEAVGWADRCAEELGRALGWLAEDGAWPEGPGGWAFAMAAAAPFWDAYVRRSPERETAIFGQPWLRETWKFRLYARTPNGQFLGFGDSSPHGGYQFTGFEAGPILRLLAGRQRNAYAQWLAEREWATRPNPHTAVWEILWIDPTLEPSAPSDLPEGALFANQQIAYLRTDWSDSATLLGFRCDSLLGTHAASLADIAAGGTESLARFNNSTTHVHADANAFGIFSRGAFAIALAQYGQNEAEFQNSLLVGGEGQYRDFAKDHRGRPRGRVSAYFASAGASRVCGEAAECYPPGLTRYARRLYLVDPGIVFLFDEVSAQVPAVFSWQFHVDDGASVRIEEAGFESTASGLRTVVRFQGLRFDQTEGHDDWNRTVRVTAPTALASTELLGVVLPSLHADDSTSVELLGGGRFVVDALGCRVLAAFAPLAGPIEVGPALSADAAAAIQVTGSAASLVFVEEARRLSLSGDVVLSAETPVTASYRRAGGVGSFAVEAPRATVVTLASGMSDPRVWARDGQEVSARVAGDRVELSVPTGMSRYVVRGER